MSPQPPLRATDFIGHIVSIKMDRPLGSQHPRHGFEYPVNYGSVPGVESGDGDELDAYVLGVHEPVDEFTGRCIAVIHRLDDVADDKLIIVPDGQSMTDDEILRQTHFVERYFQPTVLRS